MLKKTKIIKSKPIGSPKLEKEFQKELKNSSKISVIKERVKKNIGKIVYVISGTNIIESPKIDLKGKLTCSDYYSVESECLDYVSFSINQIKSIMTRNKTVTIYLK